MWAPWWWEGEDHVEAHAMCVVSARKTTTRGKAKGYDVGGVGLGRKGVAVSGQRRKRPRREERKRGREGWAGEERVAQVRGVRFYFSFLFLF
jgi:hypothetical protein